MSRRAPRPLSLAIGGLTDRLAPRTTLAEVQRAWPAAVGPIITREATPAAERDGVVTIVCQASVWAQELDLMAVELVSKLNDELGSDLVTGLRCVASPPRSWAAPTHADERSWGF